HALAPFVGDTARGKPTGQRQLGSRPAMRSGSNRKLRSVYYASPHPTGGKRRSYARNCRRSPAAVRGSAPELTSAGVAAHLAAVVLHPAIRTALGAPKSCRRISARPAASRG